MRRKPFHIEIQTPRKVKPEKVRPGSKLLPGLFVLELGDGGDDGCAAGAQIVGAGGGGVLPAAGALLAGGVLAGGCDLAAHGDGDLRDDQQVSQLALSAKS